MLLDAISLSLYPTRKQVQKSRMSLLCLLLQLYSADQAVQYGGIIISWVVIEWMYKRILEGTYKGSGSMGKDVLILW